MITGNASRGPEAACGLDLSGVLCPTRYAAIIMREDMLNPGPPGWIPRPGDLRPVTLDESGGLHAGERLAASARGRRAARLLVGGPARRHLRGVDRFPRAERPGVPRHPWPPVGLVDG